MRVARLVTGSVGLAVVSVALAAAPVAAASPYINVSPQKATPGQSIRIVASCGTGQGTGIASSDVFASVTLVPQGPALVGTAQLVGAAPGVHQVTLTCAGVPVASTALTVAGGQGAAQPTGAPAVVPETGEPTVAPATGVGSTAARGFGVVLGGAAILLLALVLAVVAAVRRSRAAVRP
ncbi:MAG TPA: hypothetical protein VF054_13675 [Micromonosporaceae bacterium]